MAHTKAGGSAKNLRDSQPKYLGIKLHDGEKAHPGNVIVRQRGTRVIAGNNVSVGKDHTLFALKEGTVRFTKVRKQTLNGSFQSKRKVSVV